MFKILLIFCAFLVFNLCQSFSPVPACPPHYQYTCQCFYNPTVNNHTGPNYNHTGPNYNNHWFGNGQNCKIKNRHFSEYFYAAAGYDYDTERRRVFTWISGEDADNQGTWTLERSANDNKYKIKSTRFDEYLYAAVDSYKFDNDRRKVFTWKPKTSCETHCYWDIQLVKQNGNSGEQYFTIRNTDYKEYLYAAAVSKYDSYRRRIFTWKNDPNFNVQNDRACHWSIQCDHYNNNYY